MATRGCAGRTFHSMEARRREEREIERQYDVLYFGAIARTFARAGHIYTERETRSRLEGKEGEEKKRQGLCGPRLDKVGPYFLVKEKINSINQSEKMGFPPGKRARGLVIIRRWGYCRTMIRVEDGR